MAQVPYSPVPSERLSSTGLPDIEPSIPNAAFGGEIAQAVSGLGKTVGDVGDDIYQRAMWLQNLNNQAEAKAADANYMVRVGQLQAEYGTLEGDAAVKAYPDYVKKLQGERARIRDSLKTGMSQRMYDSDTLSTLSRSIFSAAGSAARNQKAFVQAAISAKIDANTNFTMSDPDDEGRFKSGLEENINLTRQQGMLAGKPPEAIQNDVDRTASKYYAARIYELAKTKPDDAAKLLEQDKGKLWYDDAKKVEDHVKQQQYTTGARMIATQENEDIYSDNRNKPPERGLEDRVRSARERAEKQRPGDSDYALQVEQNTRSLYTRRKQDLRDTEMGNITTVAAGVIGDYGGKVPTTVEELRALDPSVDKAWADLPAQKRSPILKALANNAKGDYAADEKSYREYMKIRGMASSDSEEERSKFMGMSIVDLELPQKWRTVLNKQQEALIRGPGGDIRVSRSLRQLQDAGIAPDIRDKDATMIYRGALQEALDHEREQTKKDPDFKRLKEIGGQLMSQVRDPTSANLGWLNNSGKVPMYQLSVPSDAVERIKNDPKLKAAGIEITDEQIKREFLRSQYIKLYGGSVRQGANQNQPIPVTPPISY